MSKLLWQLFINPLLLSILMTYIQNISSAKEPLNLKTNEILKNYGYSSVETHIVVTSDGYKLQVHRLPKSRDGNSPTKKYPVLIPHMLLGSSADWVISGPNRSLPMQLAEEGFDVWLANYRGNNYSRDHIGMTTNDELFWNFSLHELGVRDLPSIIDYILGVTQTEKVHYVGFSMGTTTFFIMASVEQTYQYKIKSCTLMAPVANIVHTTSSFKYIAAPSKRMNAIIRVTRNGELISFKNRASFVSYICRPRFIRTQLCVRLFLYSSCGKDPRVFDEDLIPLIFGHFPAGTSSKLIQHYSQSIRTADFTYYDAGPKKNLELYGSKEPPQYPLKKIKLPLTLIYADNDLLANPKDTIILKDLLPNVKEFIKVQDEYFNHFDFLFGKTITPLLNEPVIKILQKADDAADEKFVIDSTDGVVEVVHDHSTTHEHET